jgi:hypothetical protein
MSIEQSDTGFEVYQLKVTLERVRPPVWRRLLVPGTLTLAELHQALQAAMGWASTQFDYHLHQFDIDRVSYGNPEHDDGWGDIVSERDVTLEEVLTIGDRFGYWYDFGDDWHHRVVVEKVLTEGIDPAVVVCTGARRACPPEDCGGVWGYADLLAVLADVEHPSHDEMAEWAGEVDPEAFDREAVNKDLVALFSGSPAPSLGR